MLEWYCGLRTCRSTRTRSGLLFEPLSSFAVNTSFGSVVAADMTLNTGSLDIKSKASISAFIPTSLTVSSSTSSGNVVSLKDDSSNVCMTFVYNVDGERHSLSNSCRCEHTGGTSLTISSANGLYNLCPKQALVHSYQHYPPL